jgi:hypothetical protein
MPLTFHSSTTNKNQVLENNSLSITKTPYCKMGSKGFASINILILFLSIFFFFFTNLNSVKAQTVSPSPLPNCPDLSACASILQGLVKVGSPQAKSCCSIIGGLVEIDAVVCLCAVIKENVLGIPINVPIKEVFKVCEREAPNVSVCG